MENKQQRTFKKKKLTFKEFIFNDKNSLKQISNLLNLHELSSHYYRNSIMDYGYSEKNTNLTENYNIDWAFECYKIKKSIINKTQHNFITYPEMPLTKQANQVFILAMIHGRVDVVFYFFENRLINVNQSIFGSPAWPSYFILACTCSENIINAFKTQRLKYTIGWNGLSPALLFTMRDYNHDKTSHLDFISYDQYRLLLNYKGVDLVKANESIVLFPLDFACMNRNRILIKNILEGSPETGILSRLSFVLQSEENLFLILSRFEYKVDQNFLGNTPLHYTCYNCDLSAVTLLLYLDFPIVKNAQSKFPNEVGTLKAMEKTSILFNLCTTEIAEDAKIPKRVFLYTSFQDRMFELMDILKFNTKDYDKYVGIFRYLKFNKNNKILSNSRFSIISMLTFAKTASSVEQCIKKMKNFIFREIDYKPEKLLKIYEAKFKENNY